MAKIAILIQARVSSSRFPNKVMQTVGGIPMVKRVWWAAKCVCPDYVKVAWPERYPDLDESNVLERLRRMVLELALQPSDIVVRLTADCPLLTSEDIRCALLAFKFVGEDYFNNKRDGHDVQVCTVAYLFNPNVTHREHVFLDTAINPNKGGVSVDTKAALEQVRTYVR